MSTDVKQMEVHNVTFIAFLTKMFTLNLILGKQSDKLECGLDSSKIPV